MNVEHIIRGGGCKLLIFGQLKGVFFMFEIYWFLSLYRWIWCISHQKFLVIKDTFHIDFKSDKTFIKTYEKHFFVV